MLPSLIRAMTKKTWQYWWGDRKDYLPKELGNLAKSMVYELTKWYKELEGYEADWKVQSYLFSPPGETASAVWSNILMSRTELEYAVCRLMWAMGLFTNEVWVQIRRGVKPNRCHR